MAISQISITDDRAELVEFSTPYFDDAAGVLGPVGEELTDLKEAREQQWVVVDGTTGQDFVDDVIRPEDDRVGAR